MAGILTIGAAPPAAATLSFRSSQSLAVASSISSSLSNSSSPLSSSSALPYIYCGRGDRKTAKGKRFNHSFGNARPKDEKKGRGPPRVPAPPLPPRKDRFDDGQVVKIEIDESLS